MSAFLTSFVPVVLLGGSLAAIFSCLAARASDRLWTFGLMLAGILTMWTSLFLGADFGYRAWQSIPNPPDSAFKDTSVAGMLLFGWIPAGLYCLVIMGLAYGWRRLMKWANPDVYDARNPKD